MEKETKQGLAVVGGLVGAGLAILGITKAKAAAPPPEYCCPYCPGCFATYEELVGHVKDVHPGERIPLPIEWD